MKTIFTLASCALLSVGTLLAQIDCDGTRYRTENLFSDVEVTSGITFGANTAVGGGNQVLRLDVYQPAGDTRTDRPVIIMAFGGSFISGQRTDVAPICRLFAKMGYVAVAPDYRVGFFLPNQVTTTLAVMRGAHDMKAVVRFLRKSVAENSNPYGIDAERIILGGVSAGAISAIHAAYLDGDEEIPAYMENDTAGLGGVEGISGNPGYSSRPLAVLSFSGAIGDSAWINAGDPPIVSIHEDLDGTVPYDTREVSVLGIATGLIASGSRDVHARASNEGIDNCLLTFPDNTGHTGYLAGGINADVREFMIRFCADMVCGASSNCSSVYVGVDEAEQEQGILALFPNPTSDILRFNAAVNGQAQVFDMTGRMVVSQAVVAGNQQLDVAQLPSGTYVLRVIGESVATALFIRE